MTADKTKPLAGRTAIVTGSGQNIGKAIALHFAEAGARLEPVSRPGRMARNAALGDSGGPARHG
jgi:NAD(P)-dependent dehydrogenase (short-subunit alcohol dehydrogenase family)